MTDKVNFFFYIFWKWHDIDMDAQKTQQEILDGSVSCYTPSPPPKKSSLPRPPGSGHSRHKELRRRLPSRETHKVRNPESPHQHPVELPPKLDLSSLTGGDSDDDTCSSAAASTGRTHQSDDRSNPELAMAVETPSTGSNCRSMQTSPRDGYQSDIDQSCSSPATSSCSSTHSAGLHNLRRYGSSGLEEESEGSVMKVKLKLKSPNSSSDRSKDREHVTRQRSSQFHGRKGGSPTGHELAREGTTLTKYAPLPDIGHADADQRSTASEDDRNTEQGESAIADRKHASSDYLDEEIRERRLRALERSASQTEINVEKKLPFPPPSSAKVVSRREMRMQQFARRKSASQTEAMSRSSSGTNSQTSESDKNVLLAVRLPSGSRVQNLFKSSDSLKTVVSFVLLKGSSPLEIENVCLVTNEMPKRELLDLSMSIEEAQLKDRTLMNLEELD